jgi:hypothetical protein
MARPEPLSPVGAPAEGTGAAATNGAGASLAGVPATATSPATPAASTLSAAEQFFAPAVLQPGAQLPPAPPSTFASPYRSAGEPDTAPPRAAEGPNWFKIGAVALFVIAAAATAYYFAFGGGAKQHLAPVVLAPKAPTAGLPTSLDAIVRMEAESSRRNALQAVEQVGSGNVGQLASVQPNYTYIGGGQASTDPHTVSVAQNGSTVTIAVSASNKDICAYGQWAPNTTPIYVTMAHEPACAATTAPANGWSTEAGGAASDLPDDNVG